MSEVLTEIRFWAQVVGDSRRTVICSPDLESRVKGWVAAHGMSDTITVEASPICPDNRVFVIDEHAIAAALRQEMLAAARRPAWPPDLERKGCD